MNFEYFKNKLQECIDNSDTEVAHGDADDLLCEIALSAANGNLTVKETSGLINLYNNVSKWYA